MSTLKSRQKRIEKAFDENAKPNKKAKKTPEKETGEIDIEHALGSLQVTKKEDNLQYKKLSQREQMLLRPGMYIGSTEYYTAQDPVYIYDDELKAIVWRPAEINDGLLRIFIEVLSNAIDNVWRSIEFNTTPPKLINVTIDEKKVIVWNDGRNISTKIHAEEKIPLPELIFGNLLTSSNYDDNQERKTTGLNGVGSKCLGLNVKIPLWNTNVKLAKDIQIGDELIGDDGTKRIVQNVIKGKGPMYRIDQSLGESYTVNDQHVLTLHMPDHKVIFWDNCNKGWRCVYWNKVNMTVEQKMFNAFSPQRECPECKEILASSLTRHMKRKHPEAELETKERSSAVKEPPVDNEAVQAARVKMDAFCATIPDGDGVIDISVQDYMKLNKTVQSRLAGYKAQAIEHPKREVELDPYVLGLWLGDGCKDGYKMALNTKDDPEIIAYLEQWGKENDMQIKHMGRYNYGLSSIENYGKKGFAPLKKKLAVYNLVDNKHIPEEYIINDRETRLKVLAGIIDTDGNVQRDGTRVTISQGLDHEDMIYQLAFLVRSLGFACSLSKRKTAWTWKGEKKTGEAFYLNISGVGLDEIPTLLPRKKTASPKAHNTSRTMGKITVTPVGVADYVGFKIDGNERFAINDFTVTHNCSNIFSTYFEVELYNKDEETLYKQYWTDNMSIKSDPVTKKTTTIKGNGKNGYTQVTFYPDWKRFSSTYTTFTKDMMAMMKKQVIDAAMTVSFHGVKVVLNDEPIEVKDVPSYVAHYFKEQEEAEDEQPSTEEASSEPSTPRTTASKSKSVLSHMISMSSTDCKVLVAPSRTGEFQHVSFVNGIYTKDGGAHVDTWAEAIFRPLVQKINASIKSKDKKTAVDIRDVRKHFFMFIFASLDKPFFEGQTKNKLSKPVPQTGVTDSQIAKLMKWDFVKKIEESMKMKEMLTFANEARRKKGADRVEGLEDANFAGKKDKVCVLCVCEGLSAASFVKQGVEVGLLGIKGCDYIGVYPIRGKFLNVKNAGPTTLADNKEVKGLIYALGLVYGTDYSVPDNYAKLRYKRFVCCTDSDHDGFHITGLLYNFFHTLFPTLLGVPGFFNFMRTPILKISKPNMSFFFQEQAMKFIEQNKVKADHISYYKGLGSLDDKEVKQEFGKRVVQVNHDTPQADQLMEYIFSSDHSDYRKRWLQEHKHETNWTDVKDYEIENEDLTTFLNKEMILFSLSDCKRSIPSVMDGLKESQRKVIFAAFSENLSSSGPVMKVAQFAALVAKVSCYHHGEQNLGDTIVKLAQRFVGSNNVPLLYNKGQFGSRSHLGMDAASTRYIHTKLEAWTRILFPKADEAYLTYLNEDGQAIEPEFYVPILPLVLINGNSGIGSGWSSLIPSFNIEDMIEFVKYWIQLKQGTLESQEPPVIRPYIRGFKGQLTNEPNKIRTVGVYTKVKENQYNVTEIPVGRKQISTSKYRRILEKMVDTDKINSMKVVSQDGINFLVNVKEGETVDEELLNLVDSISTSNMVLFDSKGQIKRYKDVYEILDEFCEIRYELYNKRKNGELQRIAEYVQMLENKVQFIEGVINKKINIQQAEDKLIEQVKALGIVTRENSYDYLLTMPLRSLTETRLKSLKTEVINAKAEHASLKAKSIDSLWLEECQEFVKSIKSLDNEVKDEVKTKKVVTKAK
jgi:DNA topoisomerase-2